MMTRNPSLVFAVLLAILLNGCAREAVVVGSKDFAENRVLAEMFALMLEEAGLPVERRIPLGGSAETFEALRSGAIHVYPEYTGTASALLGLPWNDETTVRIAAEFAKLGIQVLPPLGFESSYVVLAGEDFAALGNLESTGDLARLNGELRLAVMEEFSQRPLDGLQPFLDRYGLVFSAVEVITGADHSILYQRLVDNEADVVVGFATDAQISDFGLRTLEDDAGFFPTYTAVPLISAAAPAAVTTTLARLEGKLDARRMARLNAEVEIGYRDPRKVALEALAEVGLIDPASVVDDPPLSIAVNHSEVGGAMANTVLQAAREAAPGRNVVFEHSTAPVSLVLEGRSRAALAPSIAQFDISAEGAQRRPGIETVAAVGSYYVHAFARSNGPDALGDAATIATGPPGSAAEKLGRIIASATGSQTLALAAADTEAAIAALHAGQADAAIVIAPPGLGNVEAALARADDIRLITADDWWQGAVKLGFPFLHSAILPAGTYPPNQEAAIATLAMQATVVGPGRADQAMGIAGPSTYVEKAGPITDAVVLAFNAALGPHPDISPLLNAAAALRPRVEPGHQALNQNPGYTAFSLGILVFLGWALWLLIKPEKER